MEFFITQLENASKKHHYDYTEKGNIEFSSITAMQVTFTDN